MRCWHSQIFVHGLKKKQPIVDENYSFHYHLGTLFVRLNGKVCAMAKENLVRVPYRNREEARLWLWILFLKTKSMSVEEQNPNLA